MRGTEEEAFLDTQRFQILEGLGGGGGGVVYRAFDRSLGRQVAVKLLRGSEGDPNLRLQTAAFAALRHLTHQNLVQLLDLVQTAGRTCLVMELVEGVNLLEYVRTEAGAFDEERLRASFAQLAQGLRALHRVRRVHRDVKPSNVRVTRTGRTVLLDLDFTWDIDQVLPGADAQIRPVGTAAYMAPEQVSARELKPASDWYAFGAMLYEALTGVLPHRGADLQVLLSKQDGRVIAPRELAANVPEDLDRLCMELLAPNPGERPLGPQVLHRLGASEEALSGRFSLLSLTPSARSFVGREQELATLRGALERARDTLRVVRVQGEPGIGKTALCAEFLRRVEREFGQALTLRSTCPRYPVRPHAALHEPLARVADALRQEAQTQLPVSNSVLAWAERAFPESLFGLEADPALTCGPVPDPLERRQRVLSALRAMVGVAAERRVVVWWFDDYQWADADTQSVVAALTREPAAPRVLLLLSEDLSQGEEPSTRPRAHEVIHLRALDAAAAATLAESALEHAAFSAHIEPAEFAREGTPLFIRERLRYASFRGELPSPDVSLAELIEQRVRELSPSARALLDLVCASYDPLPVEILEQAADLPRAEFARQLASLELVGLVRRAFSGDEERVGPEHSFVAACVEKSLVGERRARAHASLLSALRAREPASASGNLLRHQLEAGEAKSAAESAQLAAEQAHEALAFQRAAELLGVAAVLDPPGDDEPGRLRLRRMAEVHAHAGWLLRAASLYREAASGAQVAEALRMRQRAAEHLLRGCAVAECLEAVEEMLASMGVGFPKFAGSALWSLASQRLRLRMRGLRFQVVDEGQIPASELTRVDVLWSSALQLTLIDMMRGADFLTRSLLRAMRLGEPQRIARALCAEAWIPGLNRHGRADSERLIEAARVLAARGDMPAVEGHLQLAQGVMALSGYRLSECEKQFAEAEQTFREHCENVAWEVNAAQVYQLFALRMMARHAEFTERLMRFQQEAEERGDTWAQTYFRSIDARTSMLVRDEPQQARAHVQDVHARWPLREGFHVQHLLAQLAEVDIDLYVGDRDPMAKLREHWGVFQRLALLRVSYAGVSLHELRGRALVLSHLRGDGNALRLAEADAQLLLRQEHGVASGFGHLLAANVARARGVFAEAEPLLQRGIKLLTPQGLDLWVLPARRVLAQLRGEAASDERRAVEGILQARGVRNVERFCAMMMPAFVL